MERILYRTLTAGQEISFEIAIRAGERDDISLAIADEVYTFPPGFQLLFVLMQPGHTVIDLGAHIGTFSLAAAAWGCRVVCVEPSPSNVALLNASVNRNRFKNVRVVTAAVSDSPGTVEFVQAGPYGLVANPAINAPVIRVPTMTVDELVAELEWERVDFIKMDVEGSEVAAVRGMSGLLVRADAPAILCEANGHTLRLLGETPNSLTAQLEQFGYRNFLVESGQLVPVQSGDLQPVCTVDYLATKRPLGSVPGWQVVSPMTTEEMVTKVVLSCASVNDHDRAYIARALAMSNRSVLSDERVIDALISLQTDASADVRAAASWFDRDRRIEAIAELLRRRALDLQADAMLGGCTVRSKAPLIGGLIAWIRRNLTAHLREPYVDPTFKRQVALNQRMIQLVPQIIDRVLADIGVSEDALRDSTHRWQGFERHLSGIEAQLDLISARTSLLEADWLARMDSAQLAELRQRIEGLRHRMTDEEESTDD